MSTRRYRGPDGDEFIYDVDDGVPPDSIVVDSLDAAWAEAEAALPEGWHVEMLNRTAPRNDAERWCAHAMSPQGGWLAFGSTATAALRALAARLPVATSVAIPAADPEHDGEHE